MDYPFFESLLPVEESSAFVPLLPESESPPAAFSSLAAAVIAPNTDLVLSTSGEGEQNISRTFQTQPGTGYVVLDYQFITSEVPGGYFGSQFNDYFNVSLRSQSGAGVAQETASMNGLGRAAFNDSGETQFRQIILPVDSEGDIVQVDVAVANVADGILDSQVVLDSISLLPADEGEYEDVTIEFKGFIPSPAVSLTNKTISRFTPLNIFGGDDRSFGEDGTSRFSQIVTVTADPDRDPTVVEGATIWGPSSRYTASQGFRVEGKPFWWWDINDGESPQETETLPTTDDDTVIVSKLSTNITDVQFDINGGNPLQPFAPELNASVAILISQQSPAHTPEYSFFGKIDGYPSYEILINGENVYSYDIEVAGTSPFDLYPVLGDREITSITFKPVPA